jgi:hypothetical protein
MVNNGDNDITSIFGLKNDWKFVKPFYGNGLINVTYSIKANDAIVFLLKY